MRTLASGNPSGTPLPGFLNSLAGPLEHYGYWAIALLLLLENIGVPVIPGETALIAGAVFAGTGRAGLNVVAVGVVAVAAAVAGAQVGYLIGKFAGRELVLHYGKYVLITPHGLDRAEAIVTRYGGIVVVIARFILGLREANGIIAGVTQMRWLTFGFFNVIGACAWVAAWLSLGYAAGDHISSIYTTVSRIGLYLLLALAVLLAGYIVRRVARRYRRSAGPEESPATQETPGTQEATEDPAPVRDSAAADDPEASGTTGNSETEESPAAETGEGPGTPNGSVTQESNQEIKER
ncbi:MAG TPA: VTT domain-containing protein [Streptosporangiaceae bacterium]|nr:VTT domain-containing protein [Streptosporangiaceae bacterium]